jgi:4-amino-4-deoxy-L-arabinose transferase-like glycosyltransferase
LADAARFDLEQKALTMRLPWSPKLPTAPRAPREGRVQELIEQIEVKRGAQLLRTISFFVVAVLLMLVYAQTQFLGLREPEAMDMGQVARNLKQGRGFVTDVIRPYQLWYFLFHRKQQVDLTAFPELVHAPVYPWYLSWALRVVEKAPTAMALKDEHAVMLASFVWILPTLALVYLLAKEWFDRRVGILAAWIYLLSGGVMAQGISGTPIAFLTCVLTASLYCIALATRFHEAQPRRGGMSLLFLAISGLLLAVGALTRYAFIFWIVPMAIYVWLTFRPRPTGLAVGEVGTVSRASGGARARFAGLLALFLLAFLIPVSAWTLNRMQVSGWFWGLASAQIKQGTHSFPADQLMRRYDSNEIQSRSARAMPRQVAVKMAYQLEKLVLDGFKKVGAQVVTACFIASFFHSFRRRDVSRMKKCLWVALALGALSVCALDGDGGGLLSVFYPLAVIFGCAFFWILYDRLNLEIRLQQLLVVGAFGLVNAAPLALVIAPPAPPLPYPPVSVKWLGEELPSYFAPEERIASDIPWAVAWYSKRQSLWVPWTIRELVSIGELGGFTNTLNGLYLTQATDNDLQNDKTFNVGDPPVDKNRYWVLMLYGGLLPDFPFKMLNHLDYRNVIYATPLPGSQGVPRWHRPYWWRERGSGG